MCSRSLFGSGDVGCGPLSGGSQMWTGERGKPRVGARIVSHVFNTARCTAWIVGGIGSPYPQAEFLHDHLTTPEHGVVRARNAQRRITRPGARAFAACIADGCGRWRADATLRPTERAKRRAMACREGPESACGRGSSFRVRLHHHLRAHERMGPAQARYNEGGFPTAPGARSGTRSRTIADP